MPSKPQGDLIREQGEEIAKLVQRMDHHQQDLVRVETGLLEARKLFQEANTQIAIILKDVSRVEKKIEEIHSRRWDVWTIVLTAMISAVIGAVSFEVSKRFQRPVQVESAVDKK